MWWNNEVGEIKREPNIKMWHSEAYFPGNPFWYLETYAKLKSVGFFSEK